MAGNLPDMLAGRNGLSPVMVGRAGELARLRRLLDARSTTDATDARVALISGEAGIGKTRLLKELIASVGPNPDAPAAPALVLGGQAGQGMPGRPFQLLRDAVASQVQDWKAVPERLASRDDALRMILYPVAPRLSCESQHGREYGQEELLGAAVDLVRELAPAMLVFEDLHWADAQSVALFGRLALTADLPILLVGTFRPEGIDRRHPLLELLAELDRQRSVTGIVLERLDQAHAHELVEAIYGGPVPFRVAEALHRRTGGNPFFLEELLATAAKGAKGTAAAPDQLASLPLPWNLTEAVLRRLDDLEPQERQVAQAAAILGERIFFDLLASVTGRGEQELIEALRRLVDEDLLVEREQDLFHFRHALTREAIAGQLLGRERRRLHEKALAALQEAGSDDWGAIVWHADGAGRPEELVAAARCGAEAYVNRGASYDALRLAEHGLAEAPADLDLLTWASKAAWLVGLLDVAAEHSEHRLEVARRQDDVEEEAASLILLARVYWERHDYERHWECVWQGLEAAKRLGPSPLLARAQARVSEAYLLADHAAEAIEWADHTMALAEQLGLNTTRVAAMVNKGTALVMPIGQPHSAPVPPAMLKRGAPPAIPAGPPNRRNREEGIALLERAIAEAPATDYDLTMQRALWNLLCNQVWFWPPERSWQFYEKLRAASERAGHDGNNVGLSIQRTYIHLVEGDQQAALDALASGRRLARARNPSNVFHYLINPLEAMLRVERGELARAGELLEQCREQLIAAPQELDRVWYWTICASLGARRGDLAAVREAIIQANGLMTARRWGLEFEHSIGLIDAARAGIPPAELRALIAEADERSGMAAWDPEVRTWVEGAPGRQHLAAALREADGDLAGTAEAYTRAAGDERYRLPFLLADCQLGAARCLLGLGRHAEALAHAREAAQLLERWPGWRRDEAQALLRRLGARDGQPVTGPDVLTAREREVAALLAEGLSNGEIARRLFISTKTASVHVSNILAKLGMASRAEVAAWAVRNGLGPAPEPAAAGR